MFLWFTTKGPPAQCALLKSKPKQVKKIKKKNTGTLYKKSDSTEVNSAGTPFFFPKKKSWSLGFSQIMYCTCFEFIYFLLLFKVTIKQKVPPAKSVLPLPVPVYIPLPMSMYSQITPQPVALPVLVWHKYSAFTLPDSTLNTKSSFGLSIKKLKEYLLLTWRKFNKLVKTQQRLLVVGLWQLPVPVFLSEKPDSSEQKPTPAEAFKADISCSLEKEMNHRTEQEDHGKEENQRQQILSHGEKTVPSNNWNNMIL